MSRSNKGNRSCRFGRRQAAPAFAFGVLVFAGLLTRPAAAQEFLVTNNAPGRAGGEIAVALRSEPRTLNPVLAQDEAARELLYALHSDLIHINRLTQRTEPALAKSWSVSADGRAYTIHLRRGIRFSDGQPLTADDVVFSFRLYLDPKLGSPQRDLLIVGGKPISVRKLDDYTIRFTLAQTYAAAERLFDGFAILPRHLLKAAYANGSFGRAWNLATSPARIAGLGPFRLKQYVPGERVVLERNPYYWKRDSAGKPLPYLDQLVFLFVPNEDAQVIRFESGDTDVLSRFSAENFLLLERQQASRSFRVHDLGPGLEFDFLFFNLNDLSAKNLPAISAKQAWFRDSRFRQAVSAAIDRQSIVRLAFNGRAAPLWGNVTPGDKLWRDTKLPEPPQSLDRARALLRSAGFSWRPDGSLADSRGRTVEFSILTSSSNSQRVKMATLIQDDLARLGMNVHVVTLEFGALTQRLLDSFDYEASLAAFATDDPDPNTEMNIWLSNGGSHLWHIGETQPATPWEAEVDRLMRQQLITRNLARRKQLYNEVQTIIASQLPIIPLASPDVLVAARNRLRNFQPAILDPYALWNVEQLYVQ